MKLKNLFIAAAVALGVSIGGLPVKVPGTSLSISGISEAHAQYHPRWRKHRHRHYHHRHYRHHHHRHRHYRRHRHNGGAAVAGAIIGLAAGAIAADIARKRYAPPPRYYYRHAPRWCNVGACASRYRSFRAYDCSFQPYRGPRRLCRM